MKDEKEIPFYQSRGFVVSLGAVILLIAASISGENEPEEFTAGVASSQTNSFDSLGCLKVSKELIDGISEGLIDSQPTGLAAGFTSSDFENVRMVALEFTPNGFSKSEIAVFATNDSNLNDEKVDGLIFPADGFAKNFSNWGENSNLNLSTVTSGVSQAKECLDFLK